MSKQQFSLSERTKQILTNFSTINPSMLFRKGNQLRTLAVGEDILAVANVVEEFPLEHGIYDLSRYLNAIKLIEDVKFEFGEKRLSLIGNGCQIKYTYASSSMIIAAPENDITLPTTIGEFELSKEVLENLTKVINTMNLPEVVFQSEKGKVFVKGMDVKNPTGDIYIQEVGTSNAPFKVVFKAEKLAKLLPENYKVTIAYGDLPGGGVAGLSKFEGQDVKYFVTPEEESIYK